MVGPLQIKRSPGRLFTFGCSFTEYLWPTFADYAWKAMGKPEGSFNYGAPGAGNPYIFSSILKASETEKINSNDTVIILWSAWYRMDFFDSIERKWTHSGHSLPGFWQDYALEYWDPVSYLIRDLSYVKAIDGFLKNIGCDFYMNSMLKPFLSINADEYEGELPGAKALDWGDNPPTHNTKIFDSSLYDGWLSWKEYMKKFPIEHSRKKKELEMYKHDSHPNPYEHWNWAKQWLPPELICSADYMEYFMDRWRFVVEQADFSRKGPMFSKHTYWPDCEPNDYTANGACLPKCKPGITPKRRIFESDYL